MDIKDIVIYRGKNIYSHKPTMKMIVDIGKYGEIPTKDIRGFNKRLLDAFPGLKTNTCGLGYVGGFLDRLKEGTYLAHVLEHVILDLQNSLGYDVKYGKTRILEEPSTYYLVYEYENEVTGLECSKAAVFILNCFLNGENIYIEEFLDYLKKVSIDAQLGPSTAAIVEEAKKRNIPVTRIGYDSLIQLNYGKLSRMVESTLTDATSCISTDIASNKQLAKSILSENKIPVPYGKVVYSEISAVMAAKQIGMPVVIKPFDANQGKGVTLNLNSEEEIKDAFREAAKYSSGIIVEKFIKGRDYRILVVGGQVKAAAERLPACVTGDGKHNIKELIDITNMDENRGESHEKMLTKIKLDTVAKNILKRKGIDEFYVPQKEEVIVLRENANLSTGGTAIDCTDQIHPDNALIAVRAAKAIGIDIAGIDFVAEDISESILKSDGAVVEVNSAPGIRMHLYPSVGQPRNVAKDIVDWLYPSNKSVNFPIVSVTGTNGKTTTVRLISHTLSLMGKTVGMTSTSGTFVNEKCICKGDNSGPLSAKALLSNKEIDVAVLETARGGMIRDGLGYDLADVGLITNITEDHLGVDGVETTQDLAFVKSLVVEAVKEKGYAVLNAEDGMTDYILGRVKTNVILFGKSKDIMQKFDRTNDIHIYIEDGFIIINHNKDAIKVVNINEIPITHHGMIACNVENCLAATSALYALHVPVEMIASGLVSFKENAGRFNLFDMQKYKVMLDYAHNKSGYEAVIQACKVLEHKKLIGVIGMPGDRPDQAIQEVGKICANSFEKIYIKEDSNLRGRNQNEVANLLKNTILKNGFSADKIVTIPSETEALKEATSHATQGDLIVVLYEKLEPLKQLLGNMS